LAVVVSILKVIIKVLTEREAVIETSRLVPKWTKRVVTEMTGRDPLGLSRVAQTITDYLLTGIITQTDRARYYSFYCWALWHIQMEESPQKFQDFVDGFRRREAAIAIATVLNNEATSPVGVTAVRSAINEGRPTRRFKTNFRVLPSNQLGGYGQYYSGSIYELGLTHRLEDGMDRITEGCAEDLAISFHDSLKNTPYIKKRLFLEKDISSRDIETSKQFLTIDALAEPFCVKEREILRQVFFSLDEKKLSDRDLLRRFTLAQVLYIVSEYEEKGQSAHYDDIDSYLVYPPYYYDVLHFEDESTSAYRYPEKFKVCRSFWRQYCLQQYITQAIESLLYAVLETVGSESGGLSLDETISRLIDSEFFSTLKDVTGNSCKHPWQLLAAFNVDKIPDESESIKLQKKIPITNGKSEAEILAIREKSPSAALAVAVLLLSCIYGKWRGIKNDIGCSYVAQHAGHELWMGSVIHSLDTWLKKDTSWPETLRFMIEEFILFQHDRVMYEKRRLDSCWLSRIEGKIVKEQDYTPRWRSSRHRNAVTILRDLGFVDVDSDMLISITKDGRKILQKVLRD